ncbi:MAG: histidine phosphotransferase family protein [Albidovulum sp.]
MNCDDNDLTALLGSRICHDLISPLGAIGNGVELLMMSGEALGPEMALISQSVQNANARIRFFRVAFGASSSGQRIGRAEILAILDDLGRGARLKTEWNGPAELPRGSVKLTFLALLCLETAMPYGGTIRVRADNDDWQIDAEAQKMKIDPELWGLVEGKQATTALAAAHVQFALLATEARRQGLMLRLTRSDTQIKLQF